ncbi:hypothetical protein CERZMDRAFT_53980, partial [Cercospora zeae-maydis SCOH1-5]
AVASMLYLNILGAFNNISYTRLLYNLRLKGFLSYLIHYSAITAKMHPIADANAYKLGRISARSYLRFRSSLQTFPRHSTLHAYARAHATHAFAQQCALPRFAPHGVLLRSRQCSASSGAATDGGFNI